MTSYFEIAGEIIECHEILTSPELRAFGTEVASISMGISEGYKSASPSSKGVSEKDSLFTHWVKVSSLGVRKMGPDLCVSIITPPLLTLNMRETESMKSDVKINTDIPTEFHLSLDMSVFEFLFYLDKVQELTQTNVCIRCGYTYCGCWR